MEIEVVGRLVECSECGREILVERGLIGVNHTLEVIATCWDCLDGQARKRAIERYKLKEEDKQDEGERSQRALGKDKGCYR